MGDEATIGDEPTDLEGVFKIWIDSDLKVQILVFFHHNPGMIETPEGLAKRMGLSPDALRHEIADHVKLGIITERQAGGRTIFAYNRNRENEIGTFVERAVKEKMKGASSA